MMREVCRSGGQAFKVKWPGLEILCAIPNSLGHCGELTSIKEGFPCGVGCGRALQLPLVAPLGDSLDMRAGPINTREAQGHR